MTEGEQSEKVKSRAEEVASAKRGKKSKVGEPISASHVSCSKLGTKAPLSGERRTTRLDRDAGMDQSVSIRELVDSETRQPQELLLSVR